MKTIVVYYSRKGSNKYLAKKIASRLSCDMEEIRPRINAFSLFLMRVNPGIHPLKHNISSYERVIMVGPIWTGMFIPPLRSFVNRYFNQIKQLVFVTCCGSTYANKDEKFGHGLVSGRSNRSLEINWSSPGHSPWDWCCRMIRRKILMLS